MITTEVLSGPDARNALKRGMDQVAKPVISSMGAKGRNTAFQGPFSAEVTNDGVTIARIIEPEDAFESIGASMLKQVGEQTNSEAGDGTSTSIALAHAIIEVGMTDSRNPMEIRRELNEDRELLVAELKLIAVPCETREQLMDVARISVEDEAIANIVVDSVMEAGKYGSVIVDDGVGYDIQKESMPGYRWDSGYVSPYMMTNEKGEAVLENVPIIITDLNLSLPNEIIPLMESLATDPTNPTRKVFIVCTNMEGSALNTAIANKQKGQFTVIASKRPATSEEMEDLAALTGATVVSKENGLSKIERHHVGTADRIIVTKDKSIVIVEDREAANRRIEQLKEGIDEHNNNDSIKRRMGMLASGMVRLQVGAKTETERSYLKRKIDDAVLATIAAQEEGTVPGGGTTLSLLALKAKSPIMRAALMRPRDYILQNAGLPIDDGKDYNVLTGDVITDHVKEGIIDPAKVVRCEIENSISLASTLLTIENVVVGKPESQTTTAQQ